MVTCLNWTPKIEYMTRLVFVYEYQRHNEFLIFIYYRLETFSLHIDFNLAEIF